MRSQDNKDRWLTTVDPATGKAGVLDDLHDDAWIREQWRSAADGGDGVAWLPDNRRFLFMSEKSGYMHVYTLDMTAATPDSRAAHDRYLGSDVGESLEQPADDVSHDQRGASGRAPFLHDAGRPVGARTKVTS